MKYDKENKSKYKIIRDHLVILYQLMISRNFAYKIMISKVFTFQFEEKGILSWPHQIYFIPSTFFVMCNFYYIIV